MAVARNCKMLLHTLCVVVRGIIWLFEYAAHNLKQQMAQLILNVPIMLLENPDAPPEVKQLGFDCLGSLAHLPDFLPELYVNYDCCPASPECLLERTMQALHKGVFPVDGKIGGPHSSALHAMVATLASSLQRVKDSPVGCQEFNTRMVEARRSKLEQRAAASVFNTSPTKGLEQLPSLWPLDSSKAATFLHQNKFIHKKALGEFFGSRSKISIPEQARETALDGQPPPDFSKQTLQAFIRSFEWACTPFDRALRELLHSFRLPGEAQMIDRIMEAFAAWYHECNPSAFASPDTGYTLAFSLMMLNTDLHNASIKKKMTCAGFIKNNRGIGTGGADLEDEFLSELFDSILKNEIRMVSEQLPEDLGAFEWEQLVQKNSDRYLLRDAGVWGHHAEKLVFGSTWSGLSLIHI
eukprot:TRINITY_DN18404_c0_g1_i1.p1 TRINITY_DN18404_c0_g1~~TRINITY_DN18404_c0_g1_i1.p1  ORF type:complete len:410 (-),score=106.77 TRINITY_DN18404_c0_g1_i1:168-1397(-)